MKEGIQSFLEAAGKWACLSLDIVKIAEEVNGAAYEWPDAVQKLLAGIQAGFVYYNFSDPDDPRNFDVLDNAGFLSFLTNKNVSVYFLSDPEQLASFKPAENEYTVRRYTRPNLNGSHPIVHFRRPSWDPLVSSVTVKTGKIDRLTVFRVL